MAATPGETSPRSAPGGAGQERRADAMRNIAAILDSAQACLTRNPDASIGEIAKAAGVGRVTLYAHFGSRSELIEGTFVHVVAHAEQALDAVDLTGDPRHALARLIGSTWTVIDQFRALLHAAQRALPPERIRDLHDRPMQRVRDLIERGRHEGAFRTDLPGTWMVATFYSVMHAAADEIAAGRLDGAEAGELLATTLLSAFTPYDGGVVDG